MCFRDFASVPLPLLGCGEGYKCLRPPILSLRAPPTPPFISAPIPLAPGSQLQPLSSVY